MDARILRELELDAVARLYAPLPEASPASAAAGSLPAKAPPVPVRAVFVEGLEWLVAAGGEGEGPFTGHEGRLVDGMLAAAGGARAEGDPMPLGQAMARRPRLVLVLGSAAAGELLEAPGPVETLRGTVFRVGEVPAVVTFHPAELLEACQKKLFAWEDLLFARRSAHAA
jgi:hypothetical protein